MRRAHVFVNGKVQGVWFRAWTEQEATRLGLSGWVRNRSDGRVEAVVEGEETAVAEMLRLFWQGPPAAQVTQVEVSDWMDKPEAPGFRTLQTV